jgi:hypothetical protein
MGYRLHIDQQSDGCAVVVALNLTRQESNALFLSGDSLVSWPTEGLLDCGDARFVRTSMFVSEMATRPGGVNLRYSNLEQAERCAALIRLQLAETGIAAEDE